MTSPAVVLMDYNPQANYRARKDNEKKEDKKKVDRIRYLKQQLEKMENKEKEFKNELSILEKERNKVKVMKTTVVVGKKTKGKVVMRKAVVMVSYLNISRQEFHWCQWAH